MSRAHTSVAEPAAPTTPADRHLELSKKTYLSSEEAAFYLGYDETYANPRRAFMALVNRLDPDKLWPCRLAGSRRLFFFRRDLDRLLENPLAHRRGGA